MRSWESVTLGEIASYMKQDSSFGLSLQATSALTGTEATATIKFGDSRASGSLSTVMAVLVDLLPRTYSASRIKWREIRSDLFHHLAAEWKQETAHYSMLHQIVLHPAYQRIIGMGSDVLLLILGELKKSPDHWFWALRAVTGEDPAQDSTTIAEATKAWLDWGAEHDLI